jgi:hypothetical protein
MQFVIRPKNQKGRRSLSDDGLVRELFTQLQTPPALLRSKKEKVKVGCKESTFHSLSRNVLKV